MLDQISEVLARIERHNAVQQAARDYAINVMGEIVRHMNRNGVSAWRVPPSPALEKFKRDYGEEAFVSIYDPKSDGGFPAAHKMGLLVELPGSQRYSRSYDVIVISRPDDAEITLCGMTMTTKGRSLDLLANHLLEAFLINLALDHPYGV